MSEDEYKEGGSVYFTPTERDLLAKIARMCEISFSECVRRLALQSLCPEMIAAVSNPHWRPPLAPTPIVQVCDEDGCKRHAFCRGKCSAHYTAMLRLRKRWRRDRTVNDYMRG